MREAGDEFFEEFVQIPLKEFGPVLQRSRGRGCRSLRREYLGKEQA
jgi:hypothetical protein